MPNARLIRGRIRSTKNIAQITKAMQMVAASRMRRAQSQVLANRPYAEKMADLLQKLAAQAGPDLPELLRPRAVTRHIGLIVISPNRGLAGGMPSAMNRAAGEFLRGKPPARIITMGRKGREFMQRAGQHIIADIPGLTHGAGLMDVVPAVRVATDAFMKGEVDAVYLGYTKYINTIRLVPTIVQILPVPIEKKLPGDYIYEPGPAAIFDALVPRYVESLIYEALLESLASEESSRMVAMKNATDNAKELVETLTLTYNKARQAAITKEILEVAGGAAALEG